MKKQSLSFPSPSPYHPMLSNIAFLPSTFRFSHSPSSSNQVFTRTLTCLRSHSSTPMSCSYFSSFFHQHFTSSFSSSFLNPTVSFPSTRSSASATGHTLVSLSQQHQHQQKQKKQADSVVPDFPHLRQTVTLTTPLYYVNAAPHMGSVYPTIAVDALARFYRLLGKKTVFVTGCDEHGEKIALAAKKATATSSPDDDDAEKVMQATQQFVDHVAQQFKDMWTLMGIDYQRFIRTTDDRHAKVVVDFMERVWTNGDIYKSTYEGIYCTGCEEYKDPKELLEGDVCAIHRVKCNHRKEENYFFALSNYQHKLEAFLDENKDFILPEERRNEVLGWVKEGVRDFSVSRANNPWGIPIPRDTSQTIYVWFDALLGYISALLDDNGEASLDNAIKKLQDGSPDKWPAEVHVIGKDILRFHAVYWPAMLMSAGLPVPRRVFGHGFLTKDGLKMGKSLGNTIEPAELVKQFGQDAVRYYFMKAIIFGKDGDYSEERFIDLVNADLANSLGNLFSRTAGLLAKNCDSKLPLAADIAASPNHPLRILATKNAYQVALCYDKLDFTGVCQNMMELAHEANMFIDHEAPWKLFKSGDKDRAATCLTIILELVRIISIGISPITPALSNRIFVSMGYSDSDIANLRWHDMAWGGLKEGQHIPKGAPVFPRLESEKPETVASK